MSTFRRNIQAILDNNPASAAAINDVLDLVDSHLLSIAASAKKSKPAPKLDALTDEFNKISAPYDSDPAAERALNQIALSIVKALHDSPENRQAHIDHLTATLASIKHLPELHKTSCEAGQLVLAALVADAGIVCEAANANR